MSGVMWGAGSVRILPLWSRCWVTRNGMVVRLEMKPVTAVRLWAATDCPPTVWAGSLAVTPQENELSVGTSGTSSVLPVPTGMTPVEVNTDRWVK